MEEQFDPNSELNREEFASASYDNGYDEGIKAGRLQAFREVINLAAGILVNAEQYGRGKTYAEERNAVLINLIEVIKTKK